jgi:hypothetical protein
MTKGFFYLRCRNSVVMVLDQDGKHAEAVAKVHPCCRLRPY